VWNPAEMPEPGSIGDHPARRANANTSTQAVLRTIGGWLLVASGHLCALSSAVAVHLGRTYELMDQLTGVIAQLERQKAAIENALAALRVVEGIAAPSPARPARKTTEAVAETTKRSLGQKKRWAVKRGESPTTATKKKVGRPKKTA
jgi:hypothetical protein